MANALTWMLCGSALILFGCSSLRHALFQSNAFDLGLFDQAVYLISQGQPPIVAMAGVSFSWRSCGLGIISTGIAVQDLS
jgi:uncharacterized membrane protein